MPTLLFDLDDTLLIYDGVTAKAWEGALQKHQGRIEGLNIPFTPLQLQEAITQTGRAYWSNPERHKKGRNNLYQARRDVLRQAFEFLKLLPKNPPSAQTEPSLVTRPLSPALSPTEELAQSIADTYTQLREDLVELFPGAIEVLTELTRRGHTLGLITNGMEKFQRGKIDRFLLAPYFQTILIEGALGFGKPDPRVFQKALTDLKAAPKDTFMIGDHLNWDIQGAAALGIKTVWFDWQHAGLPKGAPIKPDHTIQNLTELLAINF